MIFPLVSSSLAFLAISQSVNAGANGSGAKMLISHGREVVITRLDPIVNPGALSGHVHSIVGGNKFASKYDSANLVSSDCTTANIKTDKSNYWIPTLFFQFTNGSVGVVNGGISYMNAYYQNRFNQGDTNPGKVFPFPVGFSMLGGNSSSRGPGTTTANKAQSWHCLGGPVTPDTPNFPNLGGRSDCTAWMGQIYMPSCWNGVDATSKNNSHVAYPDGDVQNGPCLPGWKRIPTLFYEFVYTIDSKIYSPDKGTFMLSNGDTTGYSFHGDFTNGWDQDVIEKIVNECYGSTQGDGACDQAVEMQKGVVLSQTCEYKGEMVQEESGQTTLLSRLPGCNPVFGTSQTKADCPVGNSTLIVNKLTGLTSTPLAPVVPVNVTSSTQNPTPASSTVVSLSSQTASSTSMAPVKTKNCSKKRKRME